MYIKVKSIFYILSVAAISGCIIISGCSQFPLGKEKYTHVTPVERFQQIDTLELTKTEDVNIKEIVVEDKLEKAPDQVTLSIEECRALALENNLDLKVQLINPAIAAENVNEQEAKYEATFSVNAIYQQTNTPVAGYLDQVNGSKVNRSMVDYGITLPLKTGGEIGFDIIDYRTKTDALDSTYNPNYTPNFTASISQPLLRNAGRRASMYSIRAAEYDSQIDNANTKSEAIRIIADIDRAYWRLYTERKTLDVTKQEYNLAKDQSEQIKLQVEIGLKAEIELIWAKASEAQSRESVIVAENTVRDMERDLKLKLNKPGLGAETDTELILSTAPDPVHYRFDKNQIVESAIENRMDMLQAELELAKDESTIDYRQNQLRPSVDLEYDFTINSLGESRHDAYEMLFENDYNNHKVTLNVSVPLGNKARKSALRRAEYERSQKLINRDKKKNQIEYEVLGDVDRLEASWQSILATRQTTIYRDKQYEAEKRQYELGMQTLRDVLEAQKELTNAQKNEIGALTDYQLGLINLAASTGTLLGAAKVELGPINK